MLSHLAEQQCNVELPRDLGNLFLKFYRPFLIHLIPILWWGGGTGRTAFTHRPWPPGASDGSRVQGRVRWVVLEVNWWSVVVVAPKLSDLPWGNHRSKGGSRQVPGLFPTSSTSRSHSYCYLNWVLKVKGHFSRCFPLFLSPRISQCSDFYLCALIYISAALQT